MLNNKFDEIFAKLYFDEDVHKRIVNALRMRGFNVSSVHEAGRIGKSDSEQLAYATLERRAVVTFNIKDYVLLHIQYLSEKKEHYGIIVSEQLPIGELIRRLLELLNKFTADELKNNLWWI